MDNKIIYFRESALQSIIADTYSSVAFMAMMAFNHYYLEDSKFTGFILLCLFILWLSSRGKNKKVIFNNKRELIKHLEK